MVPDALRACGERVESMTDHFADDTPDNVWLAEVGKRGWIILTKDRAIGRNIVEIVQLLRSGTHAFILTSGNQTGAEMVRAFTTALPTIKKIAAKFQPPFVGTITASGHVRVLMTHTQLIERASDP